MVGIPTGGGTCRLGKQAGAGWALADWAGWALADWAGWALADWAGKDTRRPLLNPGGGRPKILGVVFGLSVLQLKDKTFQRFTI